MGSRPDSYHTASASSSASSGRGSEVDFNRDSIVSIRTRFSPATVTTSAAYSFSHCCHALDAA